MPSSVRPRDIPGGESGPIQPRPAPPDRAPRYRGSRTRPEDRGRPRERAHPHRGASRPGQVLAEPARQRRRHHHRPLHHPRPGRSDARQGHRRDDRTPTDAPGRSRPVVRLAAPPRTRVRRAPRTPPHRPPAPQERRRSRRQSRADTNQGGAKRGMPAWDGSATHPLPGPGTATLSRSTSCQSLGVVSRPRELAPQPREGGWPKASNTPPAPPPDANAPTPGASCIIDGPGQEAAAPTSPTRSRCARSTIAGSMTPATTTRPCRTAASGSADGREEPCAAPCADDVRSWRQSRPPAGTSRARPRASPRSGRAGELRRGVREVCLREPAVGQRQPDAPCATRWRPAGGSDARGRRARTAGTPPAPRGAIS